MIIPNEMDINARSALNFTFWLFKRKPKQKERKNTECWVNLDLERIAKLAWLGLVWNWHIVGFDKNTNTKGQNRIALKRYGCGNYVFHFDGWKAFGSIDVMGGKVSKRMCYYVEQTLFNSVLYCVNCMALRQASQSPTCFGCEATNFL